jgi:hypothetical protein
MPKLPPKKLATVAEQPKQPRHWQPGDTPYRWLQDSDLRQHTGTIDLQAGDKVAYSVQFLHSISCYTGALPAARGRIVRLRILGSTVLAGIEWDAIPGNAGTGTDTTDLPEWVNVCNLARVGPNARFCATDGAPIVNSRKISQRLKSS